MKLRASFALLAVVIISGCRAQQNSIGVLPNQSSFLVRFGSVDTAPADWSGSVETTGGRVLSLAPWHFDKEDHLGPKPNSWSCSTRLAAVLDPKYWWLGALHTVPKDNTIPKAPLVQNGLYITVESAQEARIKTAQGEFNFRPADARLGDPLKFLNGRVEVERVPAAFNLTIGDNREDDYPTVAFDDVSNAWAAWIGYQGEKEKLLVSRTDGVERWTIAEGEFFRPALASSVDGKLYLAVSVHEGDRYAAFTHGCSHALYRSGANIPDRKNPWGARFEGERLAIGVPLSRLHRVSSRQDEAMLVARDLRREPISRCLGADKDEEHLRIPSRCNAGASIDDLDRLELLVAVPGDNLGPRFDPDIRFRCDLLDEVVRRALGERLAPHEECD